MNIRLVDILNFRKLKKARIDISKNQTLFVGPNNSGKTSAMDALILFFKANSKFTTRDFTLSNWKDINKIGENWIKTFEKEKTDLTLEKWETYLPSIDVWLDVKSDELQYVHHLIPTLDWTNGLLGVRLRFEPNDMTELYEEFITNFKKSQKVINSINDSNKKSDFNLWPKNMWDFLDKKLNSLFTVKSYILNPKLFKKVQKLPLNSAPLDINAFSSIIKIDIINAQRGFSGTNPEENESSNIKQLSNQLRRYYDKHLNPFENPTINDVGALKAISEAKEIFDTSLKSSFKKTLEELEGLNYPGFGNPKITLSGKLNTVESLRHDSSVQFSLDDKHTDLSLPEKYNGLGYQNLISIVFKLIRFRDEWMNVGKKYDETKDKSFYEDFEPLHLVLIEEPEAHLHAQIQQVFINEAYNVLRNHKNLKSSNKFVTQLIISTHSNHIAHEVDFASIRYFKRINSSQVGEINTSEVINLSETFGIDDETTRFTTRYLKTTHCDLFFADAVILVEGPVERMLIPYFIKKYSNIDKCYVSILEIGGSHAHRLKPLIEKLEIITLIITDIDSICKEEDGRGKVQPAKSKGYRTSNDTLKDWLPKISELDKLLELCECKKEHEILPIRVAYQIPIEFNIGCKDFFEVYPYTFEDTLVMENQEIFKKLSTSKGLMYKMHKAALDKDKNESAKKMYKAITANSVKKAEFALELLFLEEPNKLIPPKYIKKGLKWLEGKLLK